MTTIDPSTTLADLATRSSAARRVLESFSLDYCCGGGGTLAQACADHDVDPARVAQALAEAAPEPAPAWSALEPAELAEHIVATHHAYLHEELARLSDLAAKVARVHGEAHPEVLEAAATYAELRDDLEPHLLKEEQVLFPMIQQLAEARKAGLPVPVLHCGTVGNPIAVMGMEHERAGELLARLREITHGYRPPEDACASYRALYQGLAELEADTHLHVHKENNVLFPAVLALEAIA